MKTLKCIVVLGLIPLLCCTFLACSKNDEAVALTTPLEEEVEEILETPEVEAPTDGFKAMTFHEQKEAAKEKKLILVEICLEQGVNKEIESSKSFKKILEGVTYQGELDEYEQKRMTYESAEMVQLFYRGEMTPVE